MVKFFVFSSIIACLSYSNLYSQNTHAFTFEPHIKFGQEAYLLRGMYTPNNMDFFYVSHSNFITEPHISVSIPENTRSTFGYRRTVLKTGNESIFYGQILFDIYEFKSNFGVKGGFGWMQSLGSQIFLDASLNMVYHNSNLYSLGPNDRSITFLYLPVNLRALLKLADFNRGEYNLPEPKWRIRRHTFDLVLRSPIGNTNLDELLLTTDMNIGYRLQKWLILEGIFKGQYDFLASQSFSFNNVRYGIGISVQPYQWKRFIPTAGISLESEFLGSGIRNIIAPPRLPNTWVSDYYFSLEFRVNRHFSLALQYTAPIKEGLLLSRQLELGTVYQF